MSIGVAIVDSDANVRQSLSSLFCEAKGFRCAATYENSKEATRGIPREQPDVVLLDPDLSRLSGMNCVRRLKNLVPHLQIVIFSACNDRETVFATLEAGASGYLLKPSNPEKILDAVSEVHNGGAVLSGHVARQVIQLFHARNTASRMRAHLTPREEELMRCVSNGYRNKQIGDLLDISTETVRVHLRNIYGKLEVGSRSEAVARYLQPGQGI